MAVSQHANPRAMNALLNDLHELIEDWPMGFFAALAGTATVLPCMSHLLRWVSPRLAALSGATGPRRMPRGEIACVDAAARHLPVSIRRPVYHQLNVFHAPIAQPDIPPKDAT